MTRKFLGRDGLADDETVTTFYSDGSGLIVCECWGDNYTKSPTWVLQELRATHAKEEQAQRRGDPLAASRMCAIAMTICEVEKLL